MNPSIPASAIVAVNPQVISAGGSALDLNGLFLSSSVRTPIGSVLSFASKADVGSFYGATSPEAIAAAVYFAGFDNSNKKPGAVLIAQYNASAVAAYLRGGNVGAALTLAQLKALPAGTLTIISDGVAETSASINLSGATSFSDAASIIQTAFTTPTFSVSYDSVSGAFIFTTTATGTSATMDFAESVDATATACTSTSTVLTIGGTVTGTFQIGDTVSGTDSTNSLPAGCHIVNQLTGTAGKAGTYTISAAATPGNLASCAVTSIGYTGLLANSLMLEANLGAVLSQGANAATPSAFMTAVTALTTDWASFMTLFNPDATGNANKQLFAAWANAQNNRYTYVAWDTDSAPAASSSATSSLGNILKTSNSSGTIPIYSVDNTIAAFICGAIASLDFNQRQGRATMCFKSQTGLAADVTNQTVGANLMANGYNFYGAYATANDQFVFFNPGSISGPFKWVDSFVNQIWLNNSFQLALMTLLTQVKSIPYNAVGYSLIRAACSDPINAAVNFGAIQAGVPLSAAQAMEVNVAAGLPIDRALASQGWYLQILPATAIVRGARQSPPINFWYMDGGSVQQISLASIVVQ